MHRKPVGFSEFDREIHRRVIRNIHEENLRCTGQHCFGENAGIRQRAIAQARQQRRADRPHPAKGNRGDCPREPEIRIR